MRIAHLCAAAALVLAPAWAQLPVNIIGAVTVIPPQPRTIDAVVLRIDGNLPSGCYSDPSAQTAVSGSTFTITLNSVVSSGPCTQALVPFGKTVVLGPLAPGSYSAGGTLFGNGGFVGQLTPASFSVTAAVIPAASVLTLIGLGAGLSLLRYRLGWAG